MAGLLDDFKDTFRKPNNTLVQLIVINIVVFLFLNILYVFTRYGEAEIFYKVVENQFTLPALLSKFIYRPWTILVYSFTHKGLFHILFNMLFLYWFGSVIVEYLGQRRLLSLYVLGALAGGLTYMLLYNLVPAGFIRDVLPVIELLGASASVYAVVVGAATLVPDNAFHLLLIGPVKLKYIALFYVVVSFISLTGVNPGGNMAHLGGALMGYIFIVQLHRYRDLGKWIHDILDLFRKKSKVKITYKKTDTKVKKKPVKKPKTKVATSSTGYSEATYEEEEEAPNQAEIDAILDKISQSGYESLSKEEKQKLFKASKG